MLDEKDETTLHEILSRMFPNAEREALSVGKRPSTVAAAYMRERIRAAFRPLGDSVATAESVHDRRARLFEYALQIWDVATGEDRGELMAESDAERVRGLAAVCGAIAGHIADFHEDEALRDQVTADTLRRLPTFRTSLSVAGGEAMMRIRYEAAGVPHLATARIARDKLSDLDA